jgi:3-oxoacyl-[acyl-carrier protein] reductase
VTGASRGIGRALSVALASRGARVGLLARGRRELEALAAELPGDHVVLEADVADREQLTAAIERFATEAGGLELVVANAGIAHHAPFVDLEVDRAEEMVRVNLLGTIYTLKAALPLMLDRGAGHVVVVSSGAALRSFPWAATYGATKAGVRGLAEALRHELSGTGVGLTTVFPGEVATDLHAHDRERLPDWYRSGDAIDPERVAEATIEAVEGDRRAVYTPPIVRALGLYGIAPRLADRILRTLRGHTAAPRRD